MTKKEKQEIPKEKKEQYERLIQTIPELEINSGFGFPYTSLNRHMFSFLAKTGSVGIRLPKEERQTFLDKFNTTLFHYHNGLY